MNKIIIKLAFVATIMLLQSCKDELDLVIPYPTNITLNELKLDKDFTHYIPDGGFSSQGINFNTIKGANNQLEAGFCYSNRSMRSFVWKNDEVSIDSVRYSVWTSKPNNTETYAVCHVKGDDAYFTLDSPATIEYLLVSNTTWGYLATNYGDEYCNINKETGEKEPVANPNVPSEVKGIWYSYVPGGVRKMDKENKDFFRITAKGYLNGAQTGESTFDLVCRGANGEFPKWDFVVSDWTRWDLAKLGTVDKVVFYLDSTDKDANGNMRTPAWFCLDGIQLKNK